MKQIYLKFSMLLFLVVMGLSSAKAQLATKETVTCNAVYTGLKWTHYEGTTQNTQINNPVVSFGSIYPMEISNGGSLTISVTSDAKIDITSVSTDDSKVQLSEYDQNNGITLVSTKGKAKFTSITVVYTYTIVKAPITAAGWATFVSDENTIPTGTTAYRAKLDGTKINLYAVEQIPANTAILLEGSAGTYDFLVASGTVEAIVTDLKYSTTSFNVDGSQYVLANGTNGVGFYNATPGTTLAAYKGYFEYSSPGVKSLELDKTTAVTKISAESANSLVYNLAGQRVDANYKGVVIKNGKKYLNK